MFKKLFAPTGSGWEVTTIRSGDSLSLEPDSHHVQFYRNGTHVTEQGELLSQFPVSALRCGLTEKNLDNKWYIPCAVTVEDFKETADFIAIVLGMVAVEDRRYSNFTVTFLSYEEATRLRE